MDELKLTKTRKALAEYDAFHLDYGHTQKEFDKAMDAFNAKRKAVFEAFYEETQDRNAHDIVEYMAIDEWLRKLVEKYGGD